METPTKEQKAKATRLVQKLLRLAVDPSAEEGEARNATSKTRGIMRQYGLTTDDIGQAAAQRLEKLPDPPFSWIEAEGKTAGLKWIVVALSMGHRCGYVQVPEEHPWFGLQYFDAADGRKRPMRPMHEMFPNMTESDRETPDFSVESSGIEHGATIDSKVSAHGGLTFSDTQPSPLADEGWWFGFDCAHAWDAKDPSIMSASALDLEAKYGFGDTGNVIRTTGYVEEQCRGLAEQIAAWEKPTAKQLEQENPPRDEHDIIGAFTDLVAQAKEEE